MDRIRFHPSEKDLLLFADGELGKRQAARIERHVATCWGCRARLAQTEDAINEFVALRRKLLDRRIHGASFPSARASRAQLGARMDEAAGSGRSGGWQRIGAVLALHRPLWTTGSLAALLAIFLLVEPLLAPSVSAMEAIANVRAAEQRQPQDAVLHQRVRIHRRAGANSGPATADFDVWKKAGRSRMLLAAGPSGSADRLRALYEARGADWDNPLSAASFAKLRDSLGEVRDEIRGRDQIVVTSTPAAESGPAGEVKRLELTVRRSDWHAISQKIELRDADYVLTEVLDEAVAAEKVDPSIFATAQVAMAALPPPPPSPAPHRIVPAAPVLRPPGPSAEQLDSAEIELREALHRTWADVEEAPEIRREPGRIHLRLFTESPRRKEEIQTALAGIPYLVPELADAESSASAAAPPASAPQPQLYSTEPPLAKALREYSGGLDPANNYVNAVRDSYLQVLVEASALARLAGRYSDSEWGRLSGESQQRVSRIAADHISAIRANLRYHLKLVSPVLDEMAARQQVQEPGKVEAEAGCASWRTSAQPLVDDLGALQTSFRRLFVEDKTEQPVKLSVAELLSQSLASRARLQQRQLCQP